MGIWGVIGQIGNVQNKLKKDGTKTNRPKKTPTGGDALTWHTVTDLFDRFEYFPHFWSARGSSVSTCPNQKSQCVRKRRCKRTGFYCNLYSTLRRYYFGTRKARRNDVASLPWWSLIRIAFAPCDKNAVHHALSCIGFRINLTSFLEWWRGPCLVLLIVVVAVARVGITESSLASLITIKTSTIFQ